MKIVAIKDYPIPIPGSDFSEQPNYDVIVEMTQEEYRMACFYFENEARKNKKVSIDIQMKGPQK